MDQFVYPGIDAINVILQKLFSAVFHTNTALISLYNDIAIWLVSFPLIAGYGLTIYGVFTGAGATRPVRNSSLLTLILFLIVLPFAVEYWEIIDCGGPSAYFTVVALRFYTPIYTR